MNTNINKLEGSTAYKKIDNVLRHYDWYIDYKDSKMGRCDYLKNLLQFNDLAPTSRTPH